MQTKIQNGIAQLVEESVASEPLFIDPMRLRQVEYVLDDAFDGYNLPGDWFFKTDLLSVISDTRQANHNDMAFLFGKTNLWVNSTYGTEAVYLQVKDSQGYCILLHSGIMFAGYEREEYSPLLQVWGNTKPEKYDFFPQDELITFIKVTDYVHSQIYTYENQKNTVSDVGVRKFANLVTLAGRVMSKI